jgi:rubrerythrin
MSLVKRQSLMDFSDSKSRHSLWM